MKTSHPQKIPGGGYNALNSHFILRIPRGPVLLAGGAFLLGIAAASALSSGDPYLNLAKRLLLSETQLTYTKNTLLGYVKYTDYVSEVKSAMEGQSKFLAARVNRDYVAVEHIQSSTLGITSEATVVIKYAVEYSVGYDLKPGSFSIVGDDHGLTVKLRKPELVATPAVSIRSHEIPNSGLFIDEKEAVIAIQRQLLPMASNRGNAIRSEAAVVALCEKQLSEFIRGILGSKAGVKSVPAIRFIYV